jgi:PKD repeat protein
MNAFIHTAGKAIRLLIAAALSLSVPSLLNAGVTTYTDETAFQIELLRLGYTTVIEGFEDEDDPVWESVRSSITAPSVTSQGITWTHNFPNPPSNSHGVTTGAGAARTGNWGFYASPHGNFLVGCTVPGDCGDGFKGSTPVGTPMFAVGGWISTNTPPAQVGAFLDNATTPQDFGDVPLSPPNSQRFFGLIETAGFNDFEFRELEGTSEDAKFIFSDDFTIGLAATGCGSNTPPTAAFTFAQSDAYVTFTDASSDTDGTVVQWLWDFGDGTFSSQENPSHTYASNGTYSVIHYVRDDGNCAGESLPQMISVTSHAPADIAITNPANGASVSGTITLEVSIVGPPSAVKDVSYFLDDGEFDNSEDEPFSVSWDTTATPDGMHTLEARLVKIDDTEIFSDPVTFTVSNAPPPTPLETWRLAHFSAADLADLTKEAPIWGDDADPDFDGNRNWKEYVFGGDPRDPSDASFHVRVQTTMGAGGEPVLEVTYWRRTNDPALTFTHEVAADLQTWLSGPAYTTLVGTVPVDGEILQVTFKETGLGVTDGRQFGRVTVTGP